MDPQEPSRKRRRKGVSFPPVDYEDDYSEVTDFNEYELDEAERAMRPTPARPSNTRRLVNNVETFIRERLPDDFYAHSEVPACEHAKNLNAQVATKVRLLRSLNTSLQTLNDEMALLRANKAMDMPTKVAKITALRKEHTDLSDVIREHQQEVEDLERQHTQHYEECMRHLLIDHDRPGEYEGEYADDADYGDYAFGRVMRKLPQIYRLLVIVPILKGV